MFSPLFKLIYVTEDELIKNNIVGDTNRIFDILVYMIKNVVALDKRSQTFISIAAMSATTVAVDLLAGLAWAAE